MAELPGVSPIEGAKSSELLSRMRYGLYLVPSKELSYLLRPFFTNRALLALRDEKLKFNAGQKIVEIFQKDRRKDTQNLKAVNDYSAFVDLRAKSKQFPLTRDGFSYHQERSERGAFTRLSFVMDIWPDLRHQLMTPPFFEQDAKELFNASIILPSEDIVPAADVVAQNVEAALQSGHPSVNDGLAQFSFFMTGLMVRGREIPASRTLRLVRPNKDN